MQSGAPPLSGWGAFFGVGMSLSWVQYAYGCIDAATGTRQFFIVGPLTGPSVIREVLLIFQWNGFMRQQFGLSIVTDPTPTQAVFDAGFRLQRGPVAASAAAGDGVHNYVDDGGNAYHYAWPCWVPIENRPAWLSIWAFHVGGSGNFRCSVAVKAERLWPGPSGVD